MKPLFFLLIFSLTACAAHVTHPSKSEPEMRADIKLCTKKANDKYWMHPVAALYEAYDCLEAKGYQRDRHGLAAQVDELLGEEQRKPKGPAEACRVPCRRPR